MKGLQLGNILEDTKTKGEGHGDKRLEMKNRFARIQA